MIPESLFDDIPEAPRSLNAPLADRMRPATFDEIIGQDDLLGRGRPLRQAIERDALSSIILWGPPGCGKTTLARLIAAETTAHFVAFSAVLSSIKEIRTVMAAAEQAKRQYHRRTILFIDEIHRFNKAQQDAFLPRVETGDIVLIGATTENPSFEVNSALLSRSHVYMLNPLTPPAITALLERAIHDKSRGLGDKMIEVDHEALTAISRQASGDARVALNLLELSATAALAKASESSQTNNARLDLELASAVMQRRTLRYDKNGEEHFNLISALHKSMRNSDPDAAVYWLARMLEAGEDPLYIARRLVRFASEDIGNADPAALPLAVAVKDAVHFIGMPEGNTALAQAATYLATAPKSNAVYVAYKEAAADAHREVSEPVPLHLRNAPTDLMKQFDYGKGYRYAHDEPSGVATMPCLPPTLRTRQYYVPTSRGFEKELGQRLSAWRQVRSRQQTDADSGTDRKSKSPLDDTTPDNQG